LNFSGIKHETMEKIRTILSEALSNIGIEAVDVAVEIPNDKKNGDFSSNAAMTSAKKAGKAPRRIAEEILRIIKTEGTYIEKITVAGPGFINFYISDDYLYDGLKRILDEKEDYGSLDMGNNERVMVEFVSANPTGPLHMGNARGGALGDLIASVLEKAGYSVTREFYINDAGNQIEKFARSLEARYFQYYRGEDAAPMPEDGYMGDDITAHAKNYALQFGDELLEADEEKRLAKLSGYALLKNIENIKTALASYGIEFDSWFSERSLFESGEIEETMKFLEEKGFIYEADDAKWFKSTLFGCEKDDVLVRNNGIKTYFASDIAYHREKFIKRRYDRVIDLLGADHHGHVARMYAACKALGIEEGRLEIVVFQLVRLMRDGETAKMSKRTGKAISLEDLIDEVGKDAVRFFFNMKASGSHLDFDIELAARQSNENPVYYVQYAYARICSLMRKVGEEKLLTGGTADLSLLCTKEEKDLISRLIDYPEEIRACALSLEPSRLPRYAIEIASLFHSFYNANRVIGESSEIFKARYRLVEAVKIVLGNVLGLMKISAPERM
jgi:arginyl-tRNA synthetase